MSYEIDLGMPPGGYTLTAGRDGEYVDVQSAEFTSTEDGQHFINRLEGLPSEILGKLPLQHQIRESQVDHLLAICRADGKATVYVNELILRALVRASRPMGKAGERVMKDDLVDIQQLDVGVEIPRDAGVLFLFSIGWRKGLFYDFNPISPDRIPREDNCLTQFGQFYCQVMFQERFSISESEWADLFKAKWFPFASLRNETIEAILGHVRSGWNPDELLERVVTEINERLPSLIDVWRKHSPFEPHFAIIERAAGHFKNGDYLSCTALLFPRIEGILRTHHATAGLPQRPSPDNLSTSAVSSQIENDRSLLLPRKFSDFLRRVYFADFDPQSTHIDVSRHSVAHGIAAASHFDMKSAVIGLLVVDQLFYFLESKPKASE